MSIPDSIAKEHCLKAIQDIDAGVTHDFGEPTRWALVHNGSKYAPKAVLGIAAKYATGQNLGPHDFQGGEGTGKANPFLRDLGFEVALRSDSEIEDRASAVIDSKIRGELLGLRNRLLGSGDLLSDRQLEECYTRFREKFGPDRLSALNGEDLLMTMHAHGDKNSLVYWIEFKDDDEFPAWPFGSIAGGSAFKFGLFQRKETKEWMTGSSLKQKVLSTVEAVRLAESHRNQLVSGCQALEKLPRNAGDDDYRALQEELARVAPDVSDLAWGHKYFSLMYPDKLDNYHVPKFQRFYLTLLLQIPPTDEGRYVCAGRFARIANSLEISLNHLTAVLNRWHPYHAYWRVGTRDGSTNESQWDQMKSGANVAIGWSRLGDLSKLQGKSDAKATVKEMLREHGYDGKATVVGKKAKEIANFVSEFSEGDVVIACDGATVLGIGRVIGDYEFVAEDTFSHKRPVEWLSLDTWKFSNRPPGLRTTVYKVWPGKWPDAVVEVNRRIIGVKPVDVARRDSKTNTARTTPNLPGIQGRIQAILRRKAQVILYGPPGTGKSYWAKKTAESLASWAAFGASPTDLTELQYRSLYGDSNSSEAMIRTCCFHPAYGYEDFIEGYRPETVGGQMVFNLRDGIFKQACRDAASHPDRPYFMIIDEINRGDIPRIFGELLHGLEADKRGAPLTMSVSGSELRVPKNLYLIGTMNTADRSIALFDTALRRRFGFIELMPDSSVLGYAVVSGIPLGPWLDALNQRICQHVGRDARNLQVGHAYFLEDGTPVATLPRLSRIIREDLIPLLQEYCYEDYSALENILGKGLVDGQGQAIKDHVFEQDALANLIAALLQPCPDLITSITATTSEQEPEEEANDAGDDDDLDSSDA